MCSSSKEITCFMRGRIAAHVLKLEEPKHQDIIRDRNRKKVTSKSQPIFRGINNRGSGQNGYRDTMTG